MTSPQPGKEYAGYLGVLAAEAALPPTAWTFKSNEAYRAILEHVSLEQGEAYLELVMQEFPDLWRESLCHLLPKMVIFNDSIGCPVMARFKVLDMYCSPTNFRYLYHALLALKQFAKHVTGGHVIDLGAGYGGFAYYVQELAPLFGVDVLSYSVVDLPEVLAIQTAYALQQGIRLDKAVDGRKMDAMRELVAATASAPRLLVSAYAYSEFSQALRSWYSQLLVNNCDHGFIVWNLCPVYRFTTHWITIEDERPLTGAGNKFISF